jgi:hypothetical protein
MGRAAVYATGIVLIHLLVTIVHGIAHSRLAIGLDGVGQAFVVMVVVILPLTAMALTWTARKRAGLILLALSMLGALLFGWYHHFVAAGADHVHAQPAGTWASAFAITAYALFVSESLGTYIGVHFLAADLKAGV